MHFFNGGGTGVTMPNPCLGRIAGYAIIFTGCYLDNGGWEIAITSASHQQGPPSPGVLFIGAIPVNNTTSVNYGAVFQFTTTQPNSDLSTCQITGVWTPPSPTAANPVLATFSQYGPIAATGSGFISGTAFTESGGTAGAFANGQTIKGQNVIIGTMIIAGASPNWTVNVSQNAPQGTIYGMTPTGTWNPNTLNTAYINSILTNFNLQGSTANEASNMNFGGYTGIFGDIKNQIPYAASHTMLQSESGCSFGLNNAGSILTLSNTLSLGTYGWFSTTASTGNKIFFPAGGRVNGQLIPAGGLTISFNQTAFVYFQVTGNSSGIAANFSVTQLSDSSRIVPSGVATDTIIYGDDQVLYSNGATAVAVALLATGQPGGWDIAKDGSAGAVNITPSAGATLNGATSAFTVAANTSYRLVCVSNTTGSNAVYLIK